MFFKYDVQFVLRRLFTTNRCVSAFFIYGFPFGDGMEIHVSTNTMVPKRVLQAVQPEGFLSLLQVVHHTKTIRFQQMVQLVTIVYTTMLRRHTYPYVLHRVFMLDIVHIGIQRFTVYATLIRVLLANTYFQVRLYYVFTYIGNHVVYGCFGKLIRLARLHFQLFTGFPGEVQMGLYVFMYKYLYGQRGLLLFVLDTSQNIWNFLSWYKKVYVHVYESIEDGHKAWLYSPFHILFTNGRYHISTRHNARRVFIHRIVVRKVYSISASIQKPMFVVPETIMAIRLIHTLFQSTNTFYKGFCIGGGQAVLPLVEGVQPYNGYLVYNIFAARQNLHHTRIFYHFFFAPFAKMFTYIIILIIVTVYDGMLEAFKNTEPLQKIICQYKVDVGVCIVNILYKRRNACQNRFSKHTSISLFTVQYIRMFFVRNRHDGYDGCNVRNGGLPEIPRKTHARFFYTYKRKARGNVSELRVLQTFFSSGYKACHNGPLNGCCQRIRGGRIQHINLLCLIHAFLIFFIRFYDNATKNGPRAFRIVFRILLRWYLLKDVFCVQWVQVPRKYSPYASLSLLDTALCRGARIVPSRPFGILRFNASVPPGIYVVLQRFNGMARFRNNRGNNVPSYRLFHFTGYGIFHPKILIFRFYAKVRLIFLRNRLTIDRQNQHYRQLFFGKVHVCIIQQHRKEAYFSHTGHANYNICFRGTIMYVFFMYTASRFAGGLIVLVGVIQRPVGFHTVLSSFHQNIVFFSDTKIRCVFVCINGGGGYNYKGNTQRPYASSLQHALKHTFIIHVHMVDAYGSLMGLIYIHTGIPGSYLIIRHCMYLRQQNPRGCVHMAPIGFFRQRLRLVPHCLAYYHIGVLGCGADVFGEGHGSYDSWLGTNIRASQIFLERMRVFISQNSVHVYGYGRGFSGSSSCLYIVHPVCEGGWNGPSKLRETLFYPSVVVLYTNIILVLSGHDVQMSRLQYSRFS
ncbi:pB962L [African swine fever virus]|uniref:PB962L n=1 Tax=African swine fever virus TaxID=10497 RepID=A0A894KTX3_ASF|nr:pB962L [African swine fever virus]